MSFRFHILGSSSAGNCALLRTDAACVLIDAGFSARKIQQLLQPYGLSLADIDAVFVTHEHADHIAGLRGMAKYPDLRVFANARTARVIQDKLGKTLSWQLFETGSSFRYQDLEVQTFAIPHDAHDPVGYVLRNSTSSVAWVTDLGYMPPGLQERIQNVKTLVLESNYDPQMLEQDTVRPWPIKQRIRGRHGHLANEDAYQVLATSTAACWEQVYLAHLSAHCNHPQLVRDLCAPLRDRFDLHIVEPQGIAQIG